jgi:cellulose synthase/poly-beta-1,6-N-acetylglucosamine synthase-like glycosyltransferase
VARGRYLAFTDDDCRPDRQWLRKLHAALEADPGAMVGGLVVNGLTGNPYSSASQYIHDLVYAHFNRNPRQSRFFATNNMALPRSEFLTAGGFSAGFEFAAEDRDLCDRWWRSGRAMIFVPEARITHLHAMTLTSFWRQHFSYGKGAAEFHQRSAGRGGTVSEHVSFHRRMLSWFVTLFARERFGRALALSLLLTVWQAANACGFFYGRWRR